MAFDRIDWHSGSDDFPEDLEPEAGGTHIGLFLAWIINHDLYGVVHAEESADAIQAVKDREMTGAEFLIQVCDEKFWSEDLNEVGNAFARSYYGGDSTDDDDLTMGEYLNDYDDVLGGDLPSLYHVADTWENYDEMAPVISRRFAEWQKNTRN